MAWLNLDLGIQTCLFDGLDGYAETWLQFLFPFYLWMIILFIIQFYRKFPALANRLGGENAVQVLATLLLLSYTELQRTVITIMSFTTLEYPDGVVRYVWLYDANVEFFKGKHLFLGLQGRALQGQVSVLDWNVACFSHATDHYQHCRICGLELADNFSGFINPGNCQFQWCIQEMVLQLPPVFFLPPAGSICRKCTLCQAQRRQCHSRGGHISWTYPVSSHCSARFAFYAPLVCHYMYTSPLSPQRLH